MRLLITAKAPKRLIFLHDRYRYHAPVSSYSIKEPGKLYLLHKGNYLQVALARVQLYVSVFEVAAFVYLFPLSGYR